MINCVSTSLIANSEYYALQFTSLSNSQTIVFSAPVYVSFFAFLILKEKCGVFQVCVFIFTICGVVLITRPSPIFGEPPGGDKFTSEENVIGSCLALFCSITLAITFVWIRRLRITPTGTVVFYLGIYSTIYGGIFLLAIQYAIGANIRWPTTVYQFAILSLIASLGLIGQFCITMSLKLEEAGLISLVRTIDIVVAFIYQISFFPEQKVMTTSIIGALIVCLSVVISCLNKLRDSKPDLRIFTFFGLGGKPQAATLEPRPSLKVVVTSANVQYKF